jgi:hypothetical protein
LLLLFGFAFGLELPELIHVLLDGAVDALLVETEELELFRFAQEGVGGVEGGLDFSLCASAGFGQNIVFGGAEAVPRQKSLAPYRDCLGGKCPGATICRGRSSFDRGDLKEAAGGAVRDMEPQA